MTSKGALFPDVPAQRGRPGPHLRQPPGRAPSPAGSGRACPKAWTGGTISTPDKVSSTISVDITPPLRGEGAGGDRRLPHRHQRVGCDHEAVQGAGLPPRSSWTSPSHHPRGLGKGQGPDDRLQGPHRLEAPGARLRQMAAGGPLDRGHVLVRLRRDPLLDRGHRDHAHRHDRGARVGGGHVRHVSRPEHPAFPT